MRTLRFCTMISMIALLGTVLVALVVGVVNPSMGYAAEKAAGLEGGNPPIKPVDPKALEPIPLPDPPKKGISGKGSTEAEVERKKPGDTRAVTPIQLP